MNDNATFKSTIKQTHTNAWDQAREYMPALQFNEIIQIVMDVFRAENRREAALEAAKELAERYRKPVEVYIDAFAVESVTDALKQIKFDDIASLGNTGFASAVVDAGKELSEIVKSYFKREIDEVELISRIRESGIVEVGTDFIRVTKNGKRVLEFLSNPNAEMLGKMLLDPTGGIAMMLGVRALTESYKILKESLESAALRREERIQIEETCAQSVALMREYREELQRVVSGYLFEHAETFNTGIAAMEKAILEDDIHGFIKGNTEIQEILHYDIQFRNEQEFDDLMESEEAFKL